MNNEHWTFEWPKNHESNIRGIEANTDKIAHYINSLILKFDVICLTEYRIKNINEDNKSTQ